MKVLLSPPPNYLTQDADLWNDWFLRLRNAVQNSSNVSWGDINFYGSNLTDIVTRNHNDLNNIQGGLGGQRYHLSAAQITGLVTETETALHYHKHNNMSDKQGGTTNEYYHLALANYTPVTHMTWNTQDGTVDISMNGDGNVVQQVGLETYFRVKADVAITNGQCVMVTGAVGASGVLRAAPSTGITRSEEILGIATEDIPLNGFGYITAFGLVNKIDTSAWTEGAVLYYDPTVTGGLTPTIPTAPAPKVRVCRVVISNAGNGSVVVRPTFGAALGVSISDVQITAIADKQILQYNNTLGRWENTGTVTGLKYGGATNYSEFEADGTLVSRGDATCFRDELNDLNRTGLNNPSSHIIQDLTEGALVFKTTCDLNDWAIMNVQINHDWKLGSNVKPHIHWWQAQNATPNWLIEYRWQRNGQAKTTAWTRAICNSNVYTYTSGTLNQISGFPVITPPTNYSLSDILQIRFIRDVANGSGLFAGADPYTVNVSATSADVHIEVDMFGSRQEYSK